MKNKELEEFTSKLLEIIKPTENWEHKTFVGSTMRLWTFVGNGMTYCVSVSYFKDRVLSYVLTDINDKMLYGGYSQSKCLSAVKKVCYGTKS